MDFPLLNHSSIMQYIEGLSAELILAQASLGDFLKFPDESSPSATPRHILLEELRFSRNTLRSKILDAQAISEALSNRERSLQAIALFRSISPAEYQEVCAKIDPVDFQPTPSDDEFRLLIQELSQSYRKVQSCHNDQVSMMMQIHVRTQDPLCCSLWLERVNFALARSKSYFLRKCHAVRSVRSQMVKTIQGEGITNFHSLIAARMGHGYLERIHNTITLGSNKAA